MGNFEKSGIDDDDMMKCALWFGLSLIVVKEISVQFDYKANIPPIHLHFVL